METYRGVVLKETIKHGFMAGEFDEYLFEAEIMPETPSQEKLEEFAERHGASVSDALTYYEHPTTFKSQHQDRHKALAGIKSLIDNYKD